VDALTPAGDPTHGDVATLYKMDAIDFKTDSANRSANIASTRLILSKSLRNPHCIVFTERGFMRRRL
jgi:hypothetical protein